mgnify:CR=1 FL=1
MATGAFGGARGTPGAGGFGGIGAAGAGGGGQVGGFGDTSPFGGFLSAIGAFNPILGGLMGLGRYMGGLPGAGPPQMGRPGAQMGGGGMGIDPLRRLLMMRAMGIGNRGAPEAGVGGGLMGGMPQPQASPMALGILSGLNTPAATRAAPVRTAQPPWGRLAGM